MSSASADGAVIQKTIKNNHEAITRLERLRRALESRYRLQKGQWSDDKYKELGSIIESCLTAIKKVVDDLRGYIRNLERLLIHIQQYESVNLRGGGFAAASEGTTSAGDASGGFALSDISTEIEQDSLSADQVNSFYGGYYTTVRTDSPITLYRAYGHNSGPGGRFCTTSRPIDRMDTRLATALPVTGWEANTDGQYQGGNLATHYAIIEVPAGTVLSYGTAASQSTASGYVLPGGAEQVILPENWHTDHPEWVQESGINLGFESGYSEFENRTRHLE